MKKTQEQIVIEKKQEQLVNQVDLVLKDEKELVNSMLKKDAKVLDNSIIVPYNIFVGKAVELENLLYDLDDNFHHDRSIQVELKNFAKNQHNEYKLHNPKMADDSSYPILSDLEFAEQFTKLAQEDVTAAAAFMQMHTFNQKNIRQELHTTEYTTIKALSILHGHIVGILENYKLLASRYGEENNEDKIDEIERSNQIEKILSRIVKDRDELTKSYNKAIRVYNNRPDSSELRHECELVMKKIIKGESISGSESYKILANEHVGTLSSLLDTLSANPRYTRKVHEASNKLNEILMDDCGIPTYNDIAMLELRFNNIITKIIKQSRVKNKAKLLDQKAFMEKATSAADDAIKTLSKHKYLGTKVGKDLPLMVLHYLLNKTLRQGDTFIFNKNLDELGCVIIILDIYNKIISGLRFMLGIFNPSLKSVIDETEKETQELRRSQGFDWASKVAHEIRAPISSIESELDSLSKFLKNKKLLSESILSKSKRAKGKNSEKFTVAAMVKTAKESAKKISNFVIKVDEKGKLAAPTFESINTQDFEEILRKLVNNIQMDDIKCHWDIDNFKIMCDKSQIEQIFRNLIENTEKYGFTDYKGKKEISVKIEKIDGEQEYAKITYKNTGNPVKCSNRDYWGLFQTTNKIKGSGLGMGIIKEIITYHEGKEKLDPESFKSGHKLIIELPTIPPILL